MEINQYQTDGIDGIINILRVNAKYNIIKYNNNKTNSYRRQYPYLDAHLQSAGVMD